MSRAEMQHLLRPHASFRRLPAAERHRVATSVLDLFRRLEDAHLAEKPHQAPLRQLVAWAAVGEDIAEGLTIWRRELRRVLGAGHGPALEGHGCPAPAPAGGPGCETRPSVQTPYTPTAVISVEEKRL